MPLTLQLNPPQAQALLDALALAPSTSGDTLLTPIWQQLAAHLQVADDLQAERDLPQ